MSAGNQRVVCIGRPSGADCDERSKPDVKPALRHRELGSVRLGRHRACSSWRPAGERGGDAATLRLGASVGLTIELSVEALRIVGAGGSRDAGENRQGEQGGSDDLHGGSPG